MNELKLSPALPPGMQVISWSSVTFIESAMSVCEHVCVDVDVVLCVLFLQTVRQN